MRPGALSRPAPYRISDGYVTKRTEPSCPAPYRKHYTQFQRHRTPLRMEILKKRKKYKRSGLNREKSDSVRMGKKRMQTKSLKLQFSLLRLAAAGYFVQTDSEKQPFSPQRIRRVSKIVRTKRKKPQFSPHEQKKECGLNYYNCNSVCSD